jgi:HisJ family histidinol phosphate phosphatase
MSFSMHSHSGQFCPGHAKDQLEEVIQTAITRGFQILGLTEHMPRDNDKDLYPGEVRMILLSSPPPSTSPTDKDRNLSHH